MSARERRANAFAENSDSAGIIANVMKGELARNIQANLPKSASLLELPFPGTNLSDDWIAQCRKDIPRGCYHFNGYHVIFKNEEESKIDPIQSLRDIVSKFDFNEKEFELTCLALSQTPIADGFARIMRAGPTTLYRVPKTREQCGTNSTIHVWITDTSIIVHRRTPLVLYDESDLEKILDTNVLHSVIQINRQDFETSVIRFSLEPKDASNTQRLSTLNRHTMRIAAKVFGGQRKTTLKTTWKRKTTRKTTRKRRTAKK